MKQPDEHAFIHNNKLYIGTECGSAIGLGIREVKRQIKQIENSSRDISENTRQRLEALKNGVEIWNAR